MDWKQFLSSIVESLTWPTVVVLLVILLRKPLSGLLPLLERMKFKDFEIGFAQKLGDAKTDFSKLELKESGRLQGDARVEAAEQLTSVYPRGAVLEAWIMLETSAIKALREVAPDLQVSQMKNPASLAKLLQQYGLLTDDGVRSFSDLRFLRNAAAHAGELNLSENQAAEYIKLASDMMFFLEEGGAST